MRRAGGLWRQVVTFDALCRAARRAARGQRTARAVAAFLERLEPEALALQRELAGSTWRPGPTHRFEIVDPKPRTITAVPFRDRVVHHALIAPLEPVFERRMIADSFACRKGKGTHAALRRARPFVRRHRFFLKLDVASCFASIEHAVVRATLERLVKDRRVLALCDVILAGSTGTGRHAEAREAHDRGRGRPPGPCASGEREGPVMPVASTGQGLPIGSLTSQWFANMVLDRLDHVVKERLRVRGYVRYMDDMAFFADDRRTLHRVHDEVAAYLDDVLHLRLKERATRLAPVTEGLPFLGWQVFAGTVRLQRENARRYRWRLRHRRWQWERGLLDEDPYRQAIASVVAHLAHGDTLGLRRRWFRPDDTDL